MSNSLKGLFESILYSELMVVVHYEVLTYVRIGIELYLPQIQEDDLFKSGIVVDVSGVLASLKS
jgi:hypothetical protein